MAGEAFAVCFSFCEHSESGLRLLDAAYPPRHCYVYTGHIYMFYFIHRIDVEPSRTRRKCRSPSIRGTAIRSLVPTRKPVQWWARLRLGRADRRSRVHHEQQELKTPSQVSLAGHHSQRDQCVSASRRGCIVSRMCVSVSVWTLVEWSGAPAASSACFKCKEADCRQSAVLRTVMIRGAR